MAVSASARSRSSGMPAPKPWYASVESAYRAQTTVDLFGRAETVGFYNSFVARCDDEASRELAAHGIEVSRAANGEVHALRGPGFASVQFHPESVLTLNGPAIVTEFLRVPLLGRP